MFDLRALFQRTVLGALGGVFAWGALTWISPWFGKSGASFWGTGGLIGLSLGLSLGVWEGAFRDRVARVALIGGAIGAAVGFLGGCIGFGIGNLIFAATSGGVVWRSIGWGLLGGFVGSAAGIARRMPSRIAFGSYGGLLGGLAGGSLYEAMFALVRELGFSRETGLTLAGAIGLAILGGFIGGLMGFVEDLLRNAWLIFSTGILEGQTRTLDPRKRETILGRSELADICLLGDGAICSRHARILPHGREFVVEGLEGEVRLGTGEAPRSHVLRNGDVIVLGGIRATYRSGETSTK